MRPHYPTRLRDQVQVPSILTSSNTPIIRPNSATTGEHNNIKSTKFNDNIEVNIIDGVNAEHSNLCDLRKYVLLGGFHVSSHMHITTGQYKSAHTENCISTNACLMKLWIPPRLCLSLFLSSTWKDVSIERDLLLQKIYPKIVAVGKQSRLKVFEKSVHRTFIVIH